MPKIVINEIDQTTAVSGVSDTDVVYIPGLLGKGAKTPLGVNKPTLFTSLAAFQEAVGNEPGVFTADLGYDKFATEAKPSESAKVVAKDSIDPSYVMASELLASGLPVLYEVLDTKTSVYDQLSSIYAASNLLGLADLGNYSLKYITSGGYPTFEYNSDALVNAMIALAVKRGDCVALIDHTDNIARSIDPNNTSSVYAKLNNMTLADGEFATMFTPWAKYNTVSIKTEGIRLPGSFAYLMALADMIKTNANWLAVAGASRGTVINLADGGMTTEIPNGVADYMQSRGNEADVKDRKYSINAITNIRPYGYTIWGNRTLKNNAQLGNLTATSFLNLRNLVSDVKKKLYTASRKLTFEQNNNILWVNFKSEITPLLDKMVSGYGLSGYKIVRNTSKEQEIGKAVVAANVILYPTYAVEEFHLSVLLQDNEVTVE